MNKIHAQTNLIGTMEALKVASIEDLLTYDPVDHAEKMDQGLGSRYSDTLDLALVLASRVSERKATLLNDMSDSCLSNKLDNYLKIIGLLGFKEVAKFSFTGNSYNSDPGPQETFYIFAQEETGIILAFDTYYSDSVNGGKFYYNWKPNDENKYWNATSSGCFNKSDDGLLWSGDHDCREAIVYNISRLKDQGKFIKPWFKTPFMWLVGYPSCG